MFALFKIDKGWYPVSTVEIIKTNLTAGGYSSYGMVHVIDKEHKLYDQLTEEDKQFGEANPNHRYITSSTDLEYSWSGDMTIVYKKTEIFVLVENCYTTGGKNPVDVKLLNHLGDLGTCEYKEITHLRRELAYISDEIKEKIDLINNIPLFDSNRVSDNFNVRGSQSLTNIDEVTWKEDFCSEALQEMIDEGWRLIAVCPQNNQRRPDYVLGKVKET